MSGLPGTHSCLHMILSLLTSFTSVTSLYLLGRHMFPSTCSLYTHSTCWEHPHFISPTASVELEHCYGKSDNWVECLLCTFMTPSLCLLYISPQPFPLTFILILILLHFLVPNISYSSFQQMHVDHIGERFRATPILGHLQSVYCHLAYLTYMQSTSWEMLGWMKHKLESRLPGDILRTSDMQMTPPLWQKAKKN